MTVLLIDARYVGDTLRTVRRSSRMSHRAMADVLRIPPHDLINYERGRTVVPQDILTRLIRSGICAQISKTGLI